MLTLEVPLEFIASHIMIIGFEIFLAYIYHSQCSSSIICIFHMVTKIHTYISERALKRLWGVDWKIFHKSLWMAVGVLQSQIGIFLNPNDFICHMPIWTCRTPHRLSLNSFCKKYTNISVPICFFKNSPQMGPKFQSKSPDAFQKTKIQNSAQ